MTTLNEKQIYCPYCGEHITVLLNPEDLDQDYIEDCQVCCRPITMFVYEENNGELAVEVRDENSTY